MSARDDILDYLHRIYPEGADDDQIAYDLHLRYRQQVNQLCRRMEEQGLVERRRPNGKILNFLVPSGAVPVQKAAAVTKASVDGNDIDVRICNIAAALPQFADEMRQARRLACSSPASALVAARRGLEILVRPLYRKLTGEDDNGKPLFDIISGIDRLPGVPDVIREHLHTVRRLGNVGAHGDGYSVTPGDADLAVAACLRVAEWMVSSPGMLDVPK